MGPAILHSENVRFLSNGETYPFWVDELEDGYWAIYCEYDLFVQLNNTSPKISKTDSVFAGLESISKVNDALALQIRTKYTCDSNNYITAYQSWVRDRRNFYFMN